VDPLLAVAERVAKTGYRFVTTTPATHARVLARDAPAEARDLRGVFGWNLPFRGSLLEPALLEDLERAAALERQGERLRSRVRLSTIGDRIFLHSGYPTNARDSVFFGPDTYRFARFLGEAFARQAGYERLVEVGCGTGAATIVHARAAARRVLADVNPTALRFAAVNASLAGVDAEITQADVLDGIEGPIDCVIANPPFLVDDAARLYRQGGGALGLELTLRIVDAAIARLRPGGRLLLYGATPCVDGVDRLAEELRPRIGRGGRYEEIDPDVFGEELSRPAYAGVERIALITLDLTL
jgi:methylase of polypeptide subunit release factors